MSSCDGGRILIGFAIFKWLMISFGTFSMAILAHYPVLVLLCTSASFLFITSISACDTDWNNVSGTCYRVFVEATAFTSAYDARQFCLQQGGDLASFPDYETEVNITGTIASIQPIQANRPMYTYFGLTTIEEEGIFQWLDNSTLNYNNISSPSRVDEYYNQRCVAVMSSTLDWSTPGSTSWVTVPCCFDTLEINAAICQQTDGLNISIAPENDTLYQHCYGDCGAGWYHLDGHCYSVVGIQTDDVNSTYDARQKCLSEGADLPSMRGEKVHKHVSSLMRAENRVNRSSVLYFGDNDIGSEGTFYTLNGSQSDVASIDWAAGQPSVNDTENCLLLSSEDDDWINTTWSSVSCCTPQGVTDVVCEKPMSHDIILVSPDDDVIADDCFGHIDECLSDPCQYNSTCTDQVLAYNCSCIAGYNGTQCENQINFCLSDPCQNGASCTPTVNRYSCNCTYDYEGDHCETLWNECLSNPCQNNATCIDGLNGYNCSCQTGFNGTLCETNIDECLDMNCQNNGTCEDQINKAVCRCPSNFHGEFCETEISCGLPVTVANATKTNSSNEGEFGGWMLFECNPGMKFPDMAREKIMECKASGWKPPDLPACEPHCEFIPEVPYATADDPNSQVGTMLNYTCEEGYRFADNTTSKNTTCLDDGQWDGHIDNTTECSLVICPDLPYWDHQELNTRNTTFNTTVTFWCDVGYVLHDNTTARTIKCLADGDWTAKLPPCEPVRCPVIGPADHRTVDTPHNIYSTFAKHKCDNGYRMLDGATYRIIKCDATAEWSDNITDCRADRCFPLPYVANATPSTTDADFTTTTTLTCIKGHRFQNKERSRTMTCTNTSWWNPILTECEPVLCGDIPRSINTIPSTENQLFGTVIDYDCTKGHYMDAATMDDHEAIECLENEVWNTTDIRDCWPIVCDDPPLVFNGSRELPPNNNYTALVNYACDPGFKFIDGRVIKNLLCNEFGSWNESDVSCRKDRCDPVPEPGNTWPDTRNTSWYTNVTYRCDVGHEWPDNKTTHMILCQAGGQWTETKADIPACNIKECSPVMMMSNATVNDTENHVYDTWIEYSCDIGFKFPDNSTESSRWCSQDASWEPVDFPECEIIHCPELEEVENATRDSNDTYYNKEVVYTCMNGYQYPDKTLSMSVFCTANETWTEYPPSCEVVFCPPVPEWGAAIFNSTINEFLAGVSYFCPANYTWDPSETPEVTEEGVEVVEEIEKYSTCQENKVWDPPFVDCVSLFSINSDIEGVVYESPDGADIATVACTLLCLLLAALILLDLNKIWQDLKMMRKNIDSLIESRKRNKVSDSSTCITSDA